MPTDPAPASRAPVSTSTATDAFDASELSRAASDINACLPTVRDGSVDIVAPDFPDWYLDVALRLQEAIAEHPDAWLEAVASAGDGPVAYADWMGIPKDEYDRMLSADPQQWGQRAVGAEPLWVTLEEDLATFHAPGELLHGLDGMRIDLSDLEVRFETSTWSDPQPVSPSGGAAGSLTGWEWKGSPGSLLIARVEEAPDCYLQFSSASPDVRPNTVDIRFPVPSRANQHDEHGGTPAGSTESE